AARARVRGGRHRGGGRRRGPGGLPQGGRRRGRELEHCPAVVPGPIGGERRRLARGIAPPMWHRLRTITNRRLHPAWVVLGAVTICLLASTGLRATFAVYIKPIEAEMGWSRGALSIAAAISLLLLGAIGPFAGRLADRWGPRRVIVASMALLGV